MYWTFDEIASKKGMLCIKIRNIVYLRKIVCIRKEDCTYVVERKTVSKKEDFKYKKGRLSV